MARSILTPDVVTTPYERENSGGDSFRTHKEIAKMAIDASARLKTYLFAAIDRANLKAKAPVMLRVSADCERSARVQLSGRYVLSFAGVIQNGGAL
ncbi:host cell division inhibitor Icd-like protein [Salmonella enterica subsp. enterica]